MNEPVVERTATPLLVDDLHLQDGHIGTIGLHAFRILDRRQLQLIGLSCRLQLVATAVRADSLEHP